MVKVDGDGDVRKTDGGFDEFIEVDGVGVMPGAFRDLEHDRGFFLLTGFDDGLKQLHVVDVERPQGVFAAESLGEKITGVG